MEYGGRSVWRSSFAAAHDLQRLGHERGLLGLEGGSAAGRGDGSRGAQAGAQDVGLRGQRRHTRCRAARGQPRRAVLRLRTQHTLHTLLGATRYITYN